MASVPATHTSPARDEADRADLRRRVTECRFWYHTMELAPGVVTPGWFDLRPVIDRLPWPDVRGKRCLDVGTYDGHLAFELERRGAAEVVATDISDHARWDWPPRERESGPRRFVEQAGPQKGVGFVIAKEALGSSVERRDVSVYDLSPDLVGTFDVVVCGALLLHLRDPLRALEAIRGVCSGQFLSAEQIDPHLTLVQPHRPAARLNAMTNVQWWIPNVAGHRRMVRAAGFDVQTKARPYSVPFGEGHQQKPSRRDRRLIPVRLLTGRYGVPYAALLATPQT